MKFALVDRGANQHAHVTLFKRDAKEIETPRDAAPLEFNATGRGPAHDALWTAFDNHRRQMGPAQGSTAFQTAWAELTDDQKQTIRDEEMATEKVRQTAEAAAEAERKREMEKMDLLKFDEVKKLARDVVDEKIGNHASRQQWYSAISKAAEAQRKPNETREMAFSRFVTGDADGKVMFKAMRGAAGNDYMPPTPAAPVVKANSANEEIRKLADEMTGADPSLSRLDALIENSHASGPNYSQQQRPRDEFALSGWRRGCAGGFWLGRRAR